jgi:site-specific DNA-methyltransferase (adenine-specific)
VGTEVTAPCFSVGQATIYQADCIEFLHGCGKRQFHAVVTDPPYGVVEYTSVEQAKLRSGKGGVWRIPPSFDGHQRSPLPRFTTLRDKDLAALSTFFADFAKVLLPALVPGAHMFLATNPLVSYLVSKVFADAGFERRGEIVRLVQTMRGGDRPKGAHDEFPDVTVMPRSQWEPWLLFRRPTEGRVQDNLRKYGTGGLRRLSERQPFGDVIKSSPTNATERALAPHPSLKPQGFLRQIVRASLPLAVGVVLDPFAGSGSTLAAANACGYDSVGVESDPRYFEIARTAIPTLQEYRNGGSD